MRSTRLGRRLGWLLVGFSLLLHLLTVYAYARQPDRLAAFTVMPLWVWGGIGIAAPMLAFWFLRASLSLVVTALWAITVLLGADEAKVIAHPWTSRPRPGHAGALDGRPLIRVATLNCRFFTYGPEGDPTADLAAWDPDIVLLQEVHPFQVKLFADRLYGGRGDYRSHSTNGVVTRWNISREVRNLSYRDQEVTVRLPDGREIEVCNIHLLSASTDLRLWRRDCWRDHHLNREKRLTQLRAALAVMNDSRQGRPTLLGGDFNAPPMEPIQRLLRTDFDDSFAEVGSGWGDTFQRRIPVHRIDQIHATRDLRPVHSMAVTTRHSDHRFVISDFVLPP